MTFAKSSYKLDLSRSLAEVPAMVRWRDEGLVVPAGTALQRCCPAASQVRRRSGADRRSIVGCDRATYLAVQP